MVTSLTAEGRAFSSWPSMAALLGTVALAATLLAAAPVSAAMPTTCRVGNLDTGIAKHSLQRAVDAASAGDHLRVKGTCHGITVIGTDLAIIGLQTATSGPPTLDGDARGSVLTVRRRVSVTIEDLTIEDGDIRGAYACGGGIRNRGSLALSDVVVRANRSSKVGGGVCNDDRATLVLTGSSSIRRNRADGGGGVWNDYGATLRMDGSSSIVGNRAWDGAGAYNKAILTLNGSSSIRRNRADGGGGGVNNGYGTLTLNDSGSIRRNTAAYGGGGISNAGVVRMTDASTISGNGAGGNGGGVDTYDWQATLEMSGTSSIQSNTAVRNGGGVYTWAEGGSFTMTGSSSITGNTARRGGGLFNDATSLVGVVCAPSPDANVHDNDPDDCHLE